MIRVARPAAILALALAAAAIYTAVALAGDLREDLIPYFVAHALLSLLMLGAWRAARRGAPLAWLLTAALAFRLIAALGAPTMSDDVFRYVWDGRLQVHGVHPFDFAPLDPALEHLRDENWERINHPEVKTIYPPLAQLCFALLASLGAGPGGFRLAFGALDFAVVLALLGLLRRANLPQDRVILYAWNPLAVIETAGSGHIEPLGVLFTLLATRWIIDRRFRLCTAALAAAAHVKLLPLVLFPGYARRVPTVALAVGVAVLIALALPYALTGPAIGTGLGDYAERWQHNAFVFAGIERFFERIDTGRTLVPWIAEARLRVGDKLGIPWDAIYTAIWPPVLARLVVASLALAWIVALASSKRLDALRETFLALAGVLILSPTVHPWYVLWVLPYAAALLSPGWLAFAAFSVVAYTGDDGSIPLGLRVLEWSALILPALAVALWRRRHPTVVNG